MNVLPDTLGRPVKPPSLPVAPAPASTGGAAGRTLCAPGASALPGTLEGPVSWTRTSVLPALATTGPCAWTQGTATAASVSRGTKAGTVTWRWTSVLPTPAATRRRASTRSEDTPVFVPETILVSVMPFESQRMLLAFSFSNRAEVEVTLHVPSDRLGKLITS